MKRIFILGLLGLLIMNGTVYAQNLTVSSLSGQNPQTIVDQHLSGDGVLLTNAEFNNSAGNVSTPQIGTFNYTGNVFPFHSGLVMTTGNVSVAQGPNTSGGSSAAVSTIYSDLQLAPYATSSINACAVLDFDFVAYSDTFAFNYIFGSEEYPEFVNSSFNDVFAFLLTGIDPITLVSTTKNVAVIPGTITASNPNGLPVTINNVNDGSHSNYYITNNSNCVQYDGYTTRLTAQARLLSCMTYHMHLAIGNVGDNQYDSGVFLEEGSFYSPSTSLFKDYNLDPEQNVYGDTLFQNCREVDIRFQLPRPVSTGNYYANFMFEGDANVGTDYSLVRANGQNINSDPENSTFFYQQDSTAEILHLAILPDAPIAEGQVKTAKLIVTTIFCEEYWNEGYLDAGRVDTLTFYLKSNDSIRLQDNAIEACHNCDRVFTELERGASDLLYEWIPTTGIANPDRLDSESDIPENRTYRIVAKDRFGCLSDTAEVEITIHERPETDVHISPENGCVPLSVSMWTNNAPEDCDIQWRVTNDADYEEQGVTNPFYATFDQPGLYNVYLWMSTAPGCADSVLMNHTIRVSDFPHASFTFSPEEADNGEPVEFINESEGEGTLSYSWNFGDGATSTEESPTHAYHVSSSDNMTVRLAVANEDGCSDDTTAVVAVVDNFALYVPNSFTPNNDGLNDEFLPKVNDVASYNLEIYDRQGNIVFKSDDPQQPWDGTINGKPAMTSVYVWVIRYVRYSNLSKTLTRKGSVTLLR